MDALNEAIHKFGPPEIMNTDQGSQFSSFLWTDQLRRSMKYECVYLHAWETGSQAKAGIKNWMDFYNQKRPHSALGGKPPTVIYWQRIETINPDQQEQRVA